MAQLEVLVVEYIAEWMNEKDTGIVTDTSADAILSYWQGQLYRKYIAKWQLKVQSVLLLCKSKVAVPQSCQVYTLVVTCLAYTLQPVLNEGLVAGKLNEKVDVTGKNSLIQLAISGMYVGMAVVVCML